MYELLLVLMLLLTNYHTEVDGTVMCNTLIPWRVLENESLVTFAYPAMVSAVQCQCVLSSNFTIKELNLDVLIQRKDNAENDCQSHLLLQHQMGRKVFCPANGTRPGATRVSFALSLNDAEPTILTLKNPALHLINAAVIIRSSDPNSTFTISCTALGTSLWWNSDTVINESMNGGVYVGVGVMLFVIVVLILTCIKRVSNKCGCTGKQNTEFNRRKHPFSMTEPITTRATRPSRVTIGTDDSPSEPTSSSVVPLLHHHHDESSTETYNNAYRERNPQTASSTDRLIDCSTATPTSDFVTNWFKYDDNTLTSASGHGSLWLMERDSSLRSSMVSSKRVSRTPWCEKDTRGHESGRSVPPSCVGMDPSAKTSKTSAARDGKFLPLSRFTNDVPTDKNLLENFVEQARNLVPQSISISSVDDRAVSILDYRNSPKISRHPERKKSHPYRQKSKGSKHCAVSLLPHDNRSESILSSTQLSGHAPNRDQRSSLSPHLINFSETKI